MNPSSSSDQNTVDRLAEEFVARHRRGEHPAVSEYTDRFPQHAEAIRDLFPALDLIEQVKPDAGDRTGTYGGAAAAHGRRPERLGDFRILREIGRGGMGVVYEAEQESLGRRVALKVLSAGSLADPDQVRRFEREARAAARLHHTNIVPVFGVGCQDGHHYFVMQFIAGLGLDAVLEDLRRLRRAKSAAGPAAVPAPEVSQAAGLTAAEVARSLMSGQFAGDGPIPLGATVTDSGAGEDEAAPPPIAPAVRPAADPSAVALPGSSALSGSSDPDRQYYRSVARIGIQVAEALEYANRQGVLHRDVKPSNLLLDNRGNVWVADFGLAKTAEADDLTHSGDILGTIRYMAPERFAGQCDARSDVYSLGLTLYELVALRPAFEAPDRHALIERVLHEEPERLKKRAPTVLRDLETIIAKASARDPASRYATAAALAEDLKRFVEDRPIRARRVSSMERLARWCKRNPVIAALAGTLTVVLVGATIASVLAAGRMAALAKVNERAAESERGAKLTAQAALKQAEADRREADGQRAAAEAAGREIRRQWYAASLNLMQPAWDIGQIGRLQDLLAETEWYPDRGFEWYYWQRLCHLEQHTLIGHRDVVYGVTWSRDGARLATASRDGTIKVWDAASGRERLTLRGQAGEGDEYGVAWSPDGKRLATGTQDGLVKVWDTASGRELLTLEGHTSPVVSVAWSPDGSRLATGSRDRTAKVWDAAGGRELRTFTGHTDWVWAVAWSPDGSRLATASWDGTVMVGTRPAAASRSPLRVQGGQVVSVSWSPDGSRLATGSRDGKAKIWPASGGREPITLEGHMGYVQAVSWSPDGSRLATGSNDGTAKVWDAAGGHERITHKGHTRYVRSVAWSPDGRRLATASGDGTAKVWDAGGRESLTLKGHTTKVVSVAWSPDGSRLATGSWDGTAMVWEAASGRARPPLTGHTGGVHSVAWSPDGSRLATGSADGLAKIWDAVGGREPLILRDPSPVTSLSWSSGVLSMAWSPDGKRLATGSWDGTAKVWDAAGGREPITIGRHKGGVLSVAWSPDGARMATGSNDDTVKVWDAAGGRELLTFTGHTDWVLSVAWSPDGARLATGSNDGTAKVWDAAGGHERITLKGHTGYVRSVAWSPDGSRLATASGDGTAKIWGAADGRELLTLKGHAGEVDSVAWSPDGRRLATASGDGTAKVWEAAGAEAVQAWARQDRAVQDLLERNAFRGPAARDFLRD